jgi:hypothetical protein
VVFGVGVADEHMKSVAVVIAAAHVDSRMARVYTPSLAEYGCRPKMTGWKMRQSKYQVSWSFRRLLVQKAEVLDVVP